jgi:S-formylglutathione hydrolase FrmB
MSFCQLHWFSNVIEKQVQTWVILPDGGKPPFAAFYLLHGRSDDHTTWMRRTRIEMYAAQYPMIIVMPDGFRGFYTDNDDGPAYAKYIGEELVDLIERTFPAKRSRGARAIGGLSMGGYGALRVGLGYPEKFASINSHSGVLLVGEWDSRPTRGDEHRRVFGKNPAGSNHDLTALVKRVQKAGRLPAIRIDCGTEDHLLDHNREYHRRLTELGVAHQYVEYPGGHSWDYWDIHIQEALAFHAKNLRLKK